MSEEPVRMLILEFVETRGASHIRQMQNHTLQRKPGTTEPTNRARPQAGGQATATKSEYIYVDIPPRKKIPKNSPERIVGNFYFGETISEIECIHGHEIRHFHIGRDFFVTCDSCRTFKDLGSTVLNCGPSETRLSLQIYRARITGYERIR